MLRLTCHDFRRGGMHRPGVRRTAPAKAWIAALCLAAAACARPAPVVPEEADPAAVLAAARAYDAAWESVDPDSILAFHTDDFEYYFFDQKIDEDFADVLRDAWLAGVLSYRIEMIDPSVEVFGPDGAVVSFLFRDEEVKADADTVRTSGALGYVMRKVAGRWKIARVHHAGPMPQGLY